MLLRDYDSVGSSGESRASSSESWRHGPFVRCGGSPRGEDGVLTTEAADAAARLLEAVDSAGREAAPAPALRVSSSDVDRMSVTGLKGLAREVGTLGLGGFSLCGVGGFSSAPCGGLWTLGVALRVLDVAPTTRAPRCSVGASFGSVGPLPWRAARGGQSFVRSIPLARGTRKVFLWSSRAAFGLDCTRVTRQYEVLRRG